MQRRKTSVWTPDTDPRARRQRQEDQQPDKESQLQQKTQVAQEPLPHMAGRLAADKAKPKPKPKPQVKPESQPAPDEPKEPMVSTQAKVKKGKPKTGTCSAPGAETSPARKRKPYRRGGRPRAPIGDY